MFGYDEEKLIGSGSFGNVYRVKKGDETYALKEINSKELRDREVRFLKLADHPLFPQYIDSFDEGKFYILEEYIWGRNLDECIKKRDGFTQPECMRMAIGIADGIAFLQQSDGNILFRDLKAENIILQPDGEVRLVDMGAACFLDEADLSNAGTAGSSAPEQLDGRSPQGMYSDVYAFGRLLYYMLTGKNTPDKNGNFSILSEDAGYSSSLELIIRQCTALDTAQRIPDMYTVLTRLIDIATCTPRQYKKLEKNAKKILKGSEKKGLGENEVFFSRNVQK